MALDCNASHSSRQDGQPAAAAPGPAGLSRGEAVDALYLHLPFCFHKCHYCDFYSVVEPQGQDAPRQQAFTDALCHEIERRAGQAPLRPETLFAGGGTPTYLREPLWAQLFESLHRLGILDPSAGREFTVEANPETVTPALLRRLVAGGVNRVSIGAQSFDRGSLNALERWHDPDSVPQAVQACRNAGITNLSLDLIFAIPGQTLAKLERDLDALLDLRPTHLSTYGLTYEPNTPLTAKLRVGQVRRAEEQLERDMYDLVLTRLESAGYAHYEISNWALRDTDHDYRCQHNLMYWRNKSWLGVGPGAASHVNGRRWRNAPNLTRYLADSPTPPVEDHEQLDARGRFAEQLMLGLRLREGIDWGWFESHDALRPYQREAVDEWIDRGLLEHDQGRLRLTRDGLFVADTVIARLL